MPAKSGEMVSGCRR